VKFGIAVRPNIVIYSLLRIIMQHIKSTCCYGILNSLLLLARK